MRRVLFFIGVVISLCSVWPVAAQTPDTRTPAPSPTRTPLPIDVDYITAVAFPNQVFFRAHIMLPIEELTSTSLIIETTNGNRVEVNYPEAPYLYAFGEVIAAYLWEIPEDNPPSLFTPIRYTWRFVTTTTGTIEEVQTIEFTDERTEWQTITALDEALTLTTPAEMSRNVKAIEAELRDTLRLLQKNTGRLPEVKLLIYDEDIRVGCSLNALQEPVHQGYIPEGLIQELPCDQEMANTIYQRSGYEVVQISTQRNLIANLTAPIVRETYGQLWAEKSVPLWFVAGLEQFYLRQPDYGAILISREALRSSGPFSLPQLDQQPSSQRDQAVWDAQVYGMILYLAARTSVEDVFALARDIVEAESFEAAFEARMGIDYQSLVTAWQTWIFKREAENAFTYSPYLATTPTPTASPTVTITPIPPTPTETFTPTIVRSPTPPVTITRRPPPPSPTPLPAQSFDLRPTPMPPTPLPAPTPLAILTQGNNPFIIGGGVLAVLLVILVSLLTGRRRG